MKKKRNTKEKKTDPNLPASRPAICPKPGCGCTVFIVHEDGWQCFNCMKIVYTHQPLPFITARPVKMGKYRTSRCQQPA